MESSVILKDFLISRSYLEDIISFDQFSKLLKGEADDVVHQLYSDLSKQRIDVVDQVKQSVDREFQLPLDNVRYSAQTDLKQIGKLSLVDLLNKLTSLQESIASDSTSLDIQIREIQTELMKSIENLSNLRFGNSWARGGDNTEVQTIVQNSLESIKKCESYIKRRKIVQKA
ncbi:hypothetical protein CLIB1423_03S03928 [[Candida] railenensis]|uniref:Uncharacterized protein n=1 Tax=[Candida] railenensis TaxID=45579 RepID=A0A9P0VWY2_9ASCO|nr:hypothetical protein CLIB1423_03S03928 [[Candida] railenensis]